MNIHPLSLPEIILIGKHIPLWSVHSVDAVFIDWSYKPKDLLAALSINRLFNATLTPLLWTVYNERTFNMRGFNDHSIPEDVVRFAPRLWLGVPAQGPSLATINAHCHHIRYLELLHTRAPPCLFQQPGMFKFHNTCTQLQELRLSRFVDLRWAAELVMVNPNLTALNWGYPNVVMANHDSFSQDPEGIRDLKSMFGLRKLRILRLEGWPLNTLHMCRILDNNGDTLQELDLADECFLMNGQLMNATNDGLDKSAFIKMDKQEAVDSLEWIAAGRLPFFLPRLILLSIQLKRVWIHHHLIYNLVRAIPSLETIAIHPTSTWTSMALSHALRQLCPRLNSIQNPEPHWMLRTMPIIEQLKNTVSWIAASAPGNLVHLSTVLPKLEDTTAATLLERVDRLETLDLTICSALPEVFGNLGKVLGGCRRLKRFSLRAYNVEWSVEHVPAILQSLSGCSQVLESLTLQNFVSLDEVRQTVGECGGTGNDDKGKGEVESPSDWSYVPTRIFHCSVTSCRELKVETFQWIQDKPRMRVLHVNTQRLEKVSLSST